MAKDTKDTNQLFLPGNNLFENMARVLGFSFQHLGVMAFMFMLTWTILNTAFSYDWRWPKVAFLITNICLTFFMLRRSPSMPLHLMWEEILIRPFIGIKNYGVNGSTVVTPLEREG